MNIKALNEAHAIVQSMDKNISEDDETFKAAVVMIFPLVSDTGYNIKKIAKEAGMSRPFVGKIVKNLKKNKIWHQNVIHHSGWMDDKTGTISFWLDALCALGHIERFDESTRENVVELDTFKNLKVS